MLWFTAIVGDERGSDAFSKYVTALGSGIAWRCLEFMEKSKYGQGIDSILLVFYVEGSHEWFTMPKIYRLGPLGAKERSMRFAVPITEQKLKLLLGSFQERTALFAGIFNALGDAVRKRKFADGIDFNKVKFLGDLNSVVDSLTLDLPPTGELDS